MQISKYLGFDNILEFLFSNVIERTLVKLIKKVLLQENYNLALFWAIYSAVIIVIYSSEMLNESHVL